MTMQLSENLLKPYKTLGILQTPAAQDEETLRSSAA